MNEPTPQEWQGITRLVADLRGRGVQAAEVQRALRYWQQHPNPSWEVLDTWLGQMQRSPWAGGRDAQRRYAALRDVLRVLRRRAGGEAFSPQRGALILGMAVRLLK